MQNRPIVLLTVLVLAIVLPIVGVKLYGRFATPAVALPVSATVAHFAPGVGIGSTMQESKKALDDVRWIQHLGFVGTLRNQSFTMVRLTPSAKERDKAYGNDRALVESVELVSVRGYELANTMADIGIAFRSSPKDGCILPTSESMPQRRVQYWTTSGNRGGVAFVSDWTFTSSTSTAGVAVWSMIAWAGAFNGGETLLARFDPGLCSSSSKSDAANPAAIASETMLLSLRDSVRDDSRETEAERIRAALSMHASDSLNACSTPPAADIVTRNTTQTFTLQLPGDFTMTVDGDIDRKEKHYGYGKYEWKGSDGSTVQIEGANNDQVHSYWTGAVSSECDLQIGPHRAHVDVANASINFEDRVVHAHIYLSPELALMFVGHAKSRERQAQLLSAVHTIRVLPGWGQTK